MKKGRRLHHVFFAALAAGALALAGCAGDDGHNGRDGATGATGAQGAGGEDGAAGNTGSTGATGATGADLTAVPSPESCTVCHSDTGSEHQAYYNELNQGDITVAGTWYWNDGENDHVQIDLQKNGVAFDCTSSNLDNLNIYWVGFDGTTFTVPTETPARLSIKGSGEGLWFDGTYCYSVKTASAVGDLTSLPGKVVVYGYDEQVGSLPPSRVKLVKYPFAGLASTGEVATYSSAANVAGCEKCHSIPYLKHGNIFAQVGGDTDTDFVTCKACHLDDGEGGHFEWKLKMTDTALWANYVNETTTDAQNAEIAATYAYKTRLMNDVHMSHAAEFPYPQSMANCVTCHEGKLEDKTVTDANFTAETCKSCHPVSGTASNIPSLESLWPDYAEGFPVGDRFHTITATCNLCHSESNPDTGLGGNTRFSEIHSGYDKKIYAAADEKYSEDFTVSIDEVTLDAETNKLTINFSASKSELATTDLSAASIVPTLLIGLYGYDTKDFLVGPHLKYIDDDNNGVVGNSGDKRNLEYVVGETHPRFTTVSAAEGSWVVTADLTPWKSLIDDGKVKRAEIGVMPKLTNDDGVIVALNAPSKTFDLTSNPPAFVDYFNPIVKVDTGCNNCHAALATTFHEGDRGGNIVVCRLCHTVASGGSHLEMQSRSIDSYAHAIHSMQYFDIQNVDFTDAAAALEYEEHINMPYPTHPITNCESCHNEGTYDVPDQSKSLPGVLSASKSLTGWDRNIGTVPSYVTGPASRACGSCHRAQMINEDEAGDLASFNSHTKTFGYLLDATTVGTTTATTVWTYAVETIMSLFQ